MTARTLRIFPDVRAGLRVAAAAVLVLAALALVAQPRHAEGPDDPGAVLERLPLAFEPNHGQFGADARFVARTPGQTVVLTDDGLAVTPAGVRMALVGADPSPEILGQQPLDGTVSRFVGADPAAWRSGIPTFGAVTYRAIYPGVDVVFHGAGRDVEHDFVVAPGVDPRVIQFSVEGATLTKRGDLVAGDVRFRAPQLYQEVDGQRQAVWGRFQSRGDSRFGFEVGSYDRSRPLVIDPVLVSSTYLGGSSTDTAYSVAADADGNLVITGYTESSDFPTVNPAQQPRQQVEQTRTDVFLTKVRADGSGVIWSTYLGGRGRDAAFAVAVDGAGAVYVTGYSESADFPLARPMQNFNAGGPSDVFVVKVGATGSTIDYATYIGGSGADSGSGIAVDQAGGVVVVGATGSTNFPTAKPFQNALARPDDVDGFVLRLDPAGTALTFSSFLGGGGDDHAIDVALDTEGSVYVTGDTRSTNFPTVRPLQPAPGGAGTGVSTNFSDAFVSKLRSDGTALLYSTYLGGTDAEKGTGIAVDGTGGAYVSGNTGSTNFPVVGAFQGRKGGDFDAFVAKVRPDGSGLAYSSYLGGDGSDGAEAVTVDRDGRAYVAGATASGDFPTQRPFQSAKGGGFVDAFVATVNASGNGLASSSYLGGRDDDQSAGITLDRNGNVIVVGYTNSADFPIARPFQPGKGGGVGDAFIVKAREDAAGGGGTSAPVASGRERRIRTLVTIAGGLFLAAILQSVWLRRRPRRAVPAPAPAPAPPDRERVPATVGADAALAGVQYVPGRARVAEGAGFGEEGPPRTMLDDRRHDEGEGEEEDEDEDSRPPKELWGPDRPWRQASRGPDWDTSQRPLLRPIEREPEAEGAGPTRMPAPDLWEPPPEPEPEPDDAAAAEPEPEPEPVRQREPAVRATRASAGRDILRPADEWTVVDTTSGRGTGELDPLDVWGPLTEDHDPDQWVEEWGVAFLEAAPEAPAPVTPPEPAAAPAPEPEPEVEVEVAAVAEPAPSVIQPPEPPPAPEAPPVVIPPEPAPEPEPAPQPPPVEIPAPEPEPEPQPPPVELPAPEPSPVEIPAPEPPPPPRELSLSELLAEDLAIPEPAPSSAPAPPSTEPKPRTDLDELLDEDMPIPDAAPAPPAPPVPEPVTDVPGLVGVVAEEPERDPEEDFLPPPPPRLLVNLFEPDPDDPLVQAMRALEEEPEEDGSGKG